MRRLLTLAMVLCLVTVGFAPAVSATSGEETDAQTTNDTESAETTVTILATNDMQGALVDPEKAGRLATILEQRRAAHDNPTVTVGAGDDLGPHSLSPVSQWRLPVDVMNGMEFDADAVGNHDLDYGFDEFANASEESEFSWVNANLVNRSTGEPIQGAEPYRIVERGGVSVGIVGITNTAIGPKLGLNLSEEGYEVRDPEATAKEYATMLKTEENVDVVVVTGQLGVPLAEEIARDSSNIDVITTGDDEKKYAPQEIGGTVVAEPKGNGEYVAEINLTVSDGEVTAWNGRLIANGDDVPVDGETQSLVEDQRTSDLNRTLGTTEVELDSRFSSNYADETALGNMITDAFRWETGADVSITNAGGIRSNSVYGPGEVTAGDVYSILPFSNTLVTVELTGAEIKQLLASQTDASRESQYGAQSALQVSGIQYEWVDSAFVPSEDRIKNAYINGEPLQEDETYTVTVNSFMAGWDDSVLEDAPVVNRTDLLYGAVTAEYVSAQGTVAPEDTNRIRRVDAQVASAPVYTNGRDTATVVMRQPAFSESFDEDSFYVLNETGHRLDAESIAVNDNRVFVRFDDAALQQLAANSDDLQLYGHFVDRTTNDGRAAWDHSVVNTDVDVRGVDDEDDERLTAPTSSLTTADTTTVVG